MNRWLAVVAIMLLMGPRNAPAAAKELPAVQLAGARRQPVAAAYLATPLVAIACAKSGTLIVWDWQRGEIKQEFAVGKELRAVMSISSDELLLLDSRTDELIQVSYANGKLTELRRYSLPSYPV